MRNKFEGRKMIVTAGVESGLTKTCSVTGFDLQLNFFFFVFDT